MSLQRTAPQITAPAFDPEENEVAACLRSSQIQHVARGKHLTRMLENWERAIRKYLEEQGKLLGYQVVARAWYDQVRPYCSLQGEKPSPTMFKNLERVFNSEHVKVKGVDGLEEDWLIDNPAYYYSAEKKVPKDQPSPEAPSYLVGLIQALEAAAPALPASSVLQIRAGIGKALKVIKKQVRKHHDGEGKARHRAQLLLGPIIASYRNALVEPGGDRLEFLPHGEMDLPPIV